MSLTLPLALLPLLFSLLHPTFSHTQPASQPPKILTEVILGVELGRQTYIAKLLL